MIASIIIVTYNSAAQIAGCLDAVAALLPPDAYELLVLDNASQDETVACVHSSYPQVRLIAETENWGFAGGVNRAAAQASGANILLLNPDALPEPGWAAALLAALAVPGVGVAGSKILEPDGRIQSLGTDLDQDKLLTSHRTEASSAPLIDVHAVHGAAMGFAKQLWEQLGGFDEGFFPAYWEEVDFCERARRAGLRSVVAPAAVVRHAEASSTGKYSAEFYGYYLRNRLRYAAKWLERHALWSTFRPAEHVRLANAELLDRRVAKMVYDEGVPSLGMLTPTERAYVREIGARLRAGELPADSYGTVLEQLGLAEQNSVHEEVVFASRIGALARFRTAWNNVATRWYVRPNLDQQTRYNLATRRALHVFVEQEAARAAAQALDIALLAWNLDHETTSAPKR